MVIHALLDVSVRNELLFDFSLHLNSAEKHFKEAQKLARELGDKELVEKLEVLLQVSVHASESLCLYSLTHHLDPFLVKYNQLRSYKYGGLGPHLVCNMGSLTV